MKKTLAVATIVLIVFIAYSCKKHADPTPGTVYLDLPAAAYKYSAKDELLNKKATLGRVLFYDTHLSLNNAVSCASCHKQVAGFADNVAFSAGFEGRLTKRNSMAIANIVVGGLTADSIKKSTAPLFWDGRENTLQNLVARPITNHVEMGIDDFSTLPDKLAALPYYSELFWNAYGDNKITPDRISESVAVFLAFIQSKNTRLDNFFALLMKNSGQNVAAEASGFSATEYRGYTLFTSTYNCSSCHHIFNGGYSTNDFKDIGLEQEYTDAGQGVITGLAKDNGKFKAPTLRNVTLTAPYMHDGRYKTLDEVIEHYSSGIQNSPNLDFQLRDTAGYARQMNITKDDKVALIAFLNTMTDYQLTTDPKFSNPFKIK